MSKLIKSRSEDAPRENMREKVYEFMRMRLVEGAPPSVREVQHALGFKAVQSAQEHLEALVREGKLIKEQGEGRRARGYRLPQHLFSGVSQWAERAFSVPLLGRVQAGLLTEAIENPEGYVTIDPRGVGNASSLFALRVQGDSMINAGILEGDIVIVRKQEQARSGEIVVARVADEATVKRLKISKGVPELWPENPKFSPIRPKPEDDFKLLGKVIEVRRQLETF